MHREILRKWGTDMGYEPYADVAFYRDVYKGTAIPEETLERKLRDASRHIDSLTYNRIAGVGFFNLTEFQKEIIQETVCRQADFEYENADVLETVLQSYSINGVSVQFGNSWNVFVDRGVAIKRDDYSLLCQTGLCIRLAVGR